MGFPLPSLEVFKLLLVFELLGFQILDMMFRFFSRDAVGCLDLPDQLVALPIDLHDGVGGQLAPLLLDLAGYLPPVAFQGVPVHRFTPRSECRGSPQQSSSMYGATG